MPTVDLQRVRLNDDSSAPWRIELRDSIDDVDTLLKLLGLDRGELDVDTGSDFRLRVPHAYAAKMQYGDAADPLLLQMLPRRIENSEDGLIDPVSDLGALTSNGLLQKYHGRALMITTGACAVHCRYCFRRHFPYSEVACRNSDIAECIANLREQPEIDEIILSGGDPLMLDDTRLATLITALESVPSLRYLRIHTRLPVVLPSRITAGLLSTLRASRLRTTMVIHANHANEIGQSEAEALSALHASNVTLLNQSVLLRGINDDSDTLARLSKRLHDCFTLPYYLHLLDPVRGAMHFDVAEAQARAIVSSLQASLPGYLVPRLVREIPESTSKTAISLD